MADVELRVNGKAYSGWQSIRITRGIESICNSFELKVSDRWAHQDVSWPIVEEDQCTLVVNGQQLITGYVDRRRLSLSADAHELSVSGRDLAGALVDCSAVLSAWEFANMSLISLATKLCSPFGINVAIDSAVDPTAITLGSGAQIGVASPGKGKLGGLGLPKPPAKFTVDPGETAFEVLDRACRFAGVLPVSDGLGTINLTHAGGSRADTQLVEGQNISSAVADFDATGRFAKYIVKAQVPGSDFMNGSAAASISASATDENVQRTYRQLLIRPEQSSTQGQARQRAAWEAKVRAARGDVVTVTVQDWAQASGTLWTPNTLARVKCPTLGVDGEMLITQVVMSLDDSSGTVSQIKLVRPDAFLPEPVVGTAGTQWRELNGGV